MNNKRILQTIGVIFLTITTCVFSKEKAGDQQKNYPKIDNLKKIEIFARGTTYSAKADKDTAAGKTASLIKISTVKKLGLQCIAVDKDVIPYGSFIFGYDKNGNYIEGVAVDTGGAVKSRKAAINLAKAKGYSKNSPQAKALVLDFYSNKGEITKNWDTFTVVLYEGPCFKFEMSDSQKVEHVKTMKNIYGRQSNIQLAKR